MTKRAQMVLDNAGKIEKDGQRVVRFRPCVMCCARALNYVSLSLCLRCYRSGPST